jgi:adenine-specific DNA-methyltransferase
LLGYRPKGHWTVTYKAAAISGRQLSLIPRLMPDLQVDAAAEHGEVFTREWVVDLILDLVGYTTDRDLAGLVAVEPACGTGAFLGPLVRRLSASCRTYGRSLTDAVLALQAYDLLGRNIAEARNLVRRLLIADGWGDKEVDEVLRGWLRVDDYLLTPYEDSSVDFVVGNPPYVRLEEIPDVRMRAYRETCRTMTGRSDIYVGFFEVALRSLRPGGRLGFICADRWMRNQYGRQLRHLVSGRFAVELVMSMHDVDAFEERVSAYPAVTVIRRGEQGGAVIADTTAQFGAPDAREVLEYVRNEQAAPTANDRYEIAKVPHWFSGDDSWPAGGPQRIAMIEDLADRFGPLEDPRTGTRVGIGVATGSDEVFITKTPPDIEEDRLLPLAMARDLSTGRLAWSGNYLVNPWLADGNLVNLGDYPRLRRYLEANRDKLAKRHVAGKSPAKWYRTIDKVDGKLTGHQKLLIPDMRMNIHPVLDDGTAYPHHNLYYVVSDTWDLQVLGGLLLSRVAQAFIEAYAVRMRGGTLRFQAQYLRKIRVPQPSDLSAEDRYGLATAFQKRDVSAATSIALRLYGLEELPHDLVRRRAVSGRN